MNSSMIAINRPSNELTGKLQSSQRATSSNDVFSNLLKQKLNANPADNNDVKVDTKRSAAVKDLSSRRMSKPEINVSASNDAKPDPVEVDQEKGVDGTTVSKTDKPKLKEDTDNSTKAAKADNDVELTEPLAEESAESLTEQIVPMLDLLLLLTKDMELPTQGSATLGTENQNPLTLSVEQLKAALTELNAQVKTASESGKLIDTAGLEALKAVTEDVKTLLTTLVNTPQVLSKESEDFEAILGQMEHLQEKIQAIVPKVNRSVEEISKLDTQATGSQVVNEAVKATSQPEHTDAKGAKDDRGATNKDKSFGKVIEKAEAKTTPTTHGLSSNDFQAKMESAAIAFNAKADGMPTAKMTVQDLIMDQLMNVSKMQVRTTEAGTIMSMKLNPEVLGNVEIKLEIVKNVLQAEINVENMIVKGALESNLSDLKNALSDKGYQVDQISVSVGDKQSDNQSKQQSQQQQASRWKLDEMDEKEIRQVRIKDLTDATLSYLG